MKIQGEQRGEDVGSGNHRFAQFDVSRDEERSAVKKTMHVNFVNIK